MCDWDSGFCFWPVGAETWVTLSSGAIRQSFPPVVFVMPSWLRCVAPVATMNEKSAPIVPAHDCVTHSVLHILNIAATQQMSTAQRSGYEAMILSSPVCQLFMKGLHHWIQPTLPVPELEEDHDCSGYQQQYITQTWSHVDTTPETRFSFLH